MRKITRTIIGRNCNRIVCCQARLEEILLFRRDNFSALYQKEKTKTTTSKLQHRKNIKHITE